MNNLYEYILYENVKPDLSSVTQEILDRWNKIGFLFNCKEDKIEEIAYWFERVYRMFAKLTADGSFDFSIFSKMDMTYIFPVIRRTIEYYNGNFNLKLYSYYKPIAWRWVKDEIKRKGYKKGEIDAEAEATDYLCKLIANHRR